MMSFQLAKIIALATDKKAPAIIWSVEVNFLSIFSIVFTLFSSIPFSQLKMAEIRDPSVVNQLKEFAEATCLIEAGRYKGTGFHFGSGWIMSVAHNFQNDDTDNEHLHSLLSSAKFTFTIDGTECVFSSAENRMAFIHHLQPGDEVDPRNMDIALVKLGIQYEYGRGDDDYNIWENEEQQKLNEMELKCFADIEERQVTEDEKVYAIHYGGDDNNRKKQELTVTRVSPANTNPFPTIQLQPAIKPGASGCPILNQDYKLVGLLCGGGPPGNVQAVDALMWNGGIKEYVSNGVSIIVDIGSYMAYKNMKVTDQAMNEELQKRASADKTQLMKKAKDSKLTIYLMNGEVFDGTV